MHAVALSEMAHFECKKTILENINLLFQYISPNVFQLFADLTTLIMLALYTIKIKWTKSTALYYLS